MKNDKRRIVYLALLAFLMIWVAGCGGGGGGGSTATLTPASPVTWNFLVYLDADNDLSSYGAFNFTQMQAVGSTANVNVLVLYAQPKQTQPNVILYKVVKDPTNSGKIVSTAEKNYGNVYMSNPQTLINFIEDCNQYFPAQHTVLTLWDHGGGVYPRSLTNQKTMPIQRLTSNKKNLSNSICFDSSGNSLSTDDVANALTTAQTHTGKTIDIINLDACLMEMLEVAYQWRGVTNYMTGSEEVVPADGNDYTTVLNDLTSTPSMAPQTMAVTLVNEYYNFYSTQGMNTTYSAIQTSGFTNFITTFKTFASDLVNAWTSGNSSTMTNIYSCGTTCTYFGWDSSLNYDYSEVIDLANFATKLANTAGTISSTDALAMVAAVSNLVIGQHETGVFASQDPANGLSLLLPYDSSKLKEYPHYSSDLALASDTQWYQFMQKFAAYSGTGAITAKPGY